MKNKVVWLVASCITVSLFALTGAHAGFLDDLMGYNQGNTQTHTYNVTNSGQPQAPGAVRYQAPAYTARPIPPQQPVVGQAPVAPRIAYQQPLAQNRANSQQAPSSKVVSKKKPVQNAAGNAVRPSVKAQLPNQPQQVARSYQTSYPVQPRNVLPQGYSQAPPAGYYANPYQARYTTTPNYYQGYSYNSWGSAGQACAPGRA